MAATLIGPVTASPGLPGGARAALNVTAAAVVMAGERICCRVSCLVGGSITLNDSATTGGATTANEFFLGTMTAGQVQELNWPCAAGITASAVSTGQFAISFS